MDDLIAFVAARLNEDEAAAKAWLPLGNPTTMQREHIARHDPGRVLREVAAMRAIVDGCEEAALHPYDLPEGVTDGRDDSERSRDEAVLEAMEAVAGALATIWDTHPGYRPEWRPLAP
jgi:hypothetical protein